MVESHIRDPRTIILAVLPANVDFATQEILALAEKHDPKGERTLGVLTKPDLILEPSGKQAVCNLVLGKRKRLELGYYLVCNRGPDSDGRSLEDRERMFQETPWDSLPKNRLGVGALKATLSSLLAALTKSVFSSLRLEIQKELEKATKQLDDLGSPRETETQQRIFLSNIADKFQALVTAARFGHYSQDDAFEEDKDLRLATSIVNLADGLVDEFAGIGHLYEFDQDEDEEEAMNEGETRKKVHGFDDDENIVSRTSLDAWPFVRKARLDSETETISRGLSTLSMGTGSTRTTASFDDDIGELIYDLPNYDPPKKGIRTWLEDLHRRSRGPELITPGPAILGSAFKEQSARWNVIARHFVSNCIQAVHTFIRRALSHLCPTPALATDLWYSISDDVLSRYKASLEKAAYLARIERSLNPYTLNQLFSAEVVRSRSLRLCGQITTAGAERHYGDSRTVTVDINALGSVAEHEANAQHANHEIHDALKAYYKIAAKRFQDNLYMQAVSHGLVNGEETPLGVFSQAWVLSLGVGELDGLVGDSPQTKALRTEVEGRKIDLENAVAILRG